MEVKEALVTAKETLDKILDLPEEAEDFASSVEDKIHDIVSWIEENNHVTDKQLDLLENINQGIDRWIDWE